MSDEKKGNPVKYETVTVAEDEISILQAEVAHFDPEEPGHLAEMNRLLSGEGRTNFWATIKRLVDHCDEVLRNNGWPETWRRIWVHPERGWEPVNSGEKRYSPWSNTFAALWVEKQTADFSDSWYAARIGFKCRVYLEHIDKGDAAQASIHLMAFEIGSLRIDWEWRKSQKASILTGKKVRRGAKMGGALKGRANSERRDEILSEISRLKIQHTLGRACALAFQNGFGASAAANKKLWQRYKPKSE